MHDFHKLEVDQPFNLFTGRNMIGQDGCIFEVIQGGGYTFVVYLNNMSEKEKHILRFNKITAKIIQEQEFLLTMLQFDNSNITFELLFDPSLYQDGRFLDLFHSNMINIIGVESTTNITKTIRISSTPLKLFKIWIDVWKNVYYDKDYSKKYNQWVDILIQNYSVLELWDRSVYVGKMGE